MSKRVRLTKIYIVGENIARFPHMFQLSDSRHVWAIRGRRFTTLLGFSWVQRHCVVAYDNSHGLSGAKGLGNTIVVTSCKQSM